MDKALGLYNQIKKSLPYRLEKIFKNKFRRRIEKRDKIFWKNGRDDIQERYFASDSMEKWTKSTNWQRLLENKLNAKEFAKKFGCRVATLYWTGGKKELLELDFNDLPKNYIIKPVIGHSSQDVFIMKGAHNLFDGRNYTTQELKDAILILFDSQPNLELLLEEFMPTINGSFEVPNDYRFYMFNGRVAFIRLDKRVSKKRDRVSFYTADWNLIPKKILHFASTEEKDPAPKHLDQMIEDAKRLSKEYKIFVRLDFYDTSDGAVFGEFTPTPRKGRNFTRYGSRQLITAWDKYCKGSI